MVEEARQTEQANRAEQIRKRSAEQEQEVVAAFSLVNQSIAGHLPKCTLSPPEATWLAAVSSIQHALGLAIVWAGSSLANIAAELAEANSRDREAEVRARSAEAFVAAIQAEITKAQGSSLVVPAVQVPRPKR